MARRRSTEELLEEHSVGRLVLKLGVPAMFGQFFTILYSIVDRMFVGQISGVGGTALAAIGVCSPMLTAITAFAYLVGIGGSACVGISLGQKNSSRARVVLGNAFSLLIVISIVMTAVLLTVRRPLLYALGCSDELLPYAETYFTIYVLGTIASLTGVGLNQFLLVQGMARQGMVSVAIGALANVALDALFIFRFDMGVAGAALATVIAQCCMAAYVIVQLLRNDATVRLSLRLPQTAIVRSIVSIGSMSFLIALLDNLIIVLLNVVLRAYGGESGDALITCATVVQSFLTIVFSPAQGVTTGCGGIVSYHFGAGNYKKIKSALLGIFILCGIYIGVLQVGAQLAPEVFAGLFLQDESLRQQAATCIRMYSMGLIGVAVQYALVDGLTAMGKVRYAFPLSVFRKLVYLACLFAFPVWFGVDSVFYAGSVSDVIGAGFSAAAFFVVINPRLRTEMTRVRIAEPTSAAEAVR